MAVDTRVPQKIVDYYHTIDYYVKIYICLFLLVRFNPFQTIKFNELDRQIAFSAGLVILTTTLLNTYLMKLKIKIQNQITNRRMAKEFSN